MSVIGEAVSADREELHVEAGEIAVGGAPLERGMEWEGRSCGAGW